MTDSALKKLSPKFEELYSSDGRSSIPPEKQLRALLLQLLYSIRSERQLMEQINYNLLYRWFVGLDMDEKVWDPTVFTKNRERFIDGKIAELFFSNVLEEAREKGLLSEEHFTVDGTLLEAWAGQKSYQQKAQIPEQGTGSRGELLRRDQYESKTDPDARMYRKSASGRYQLGYLGHVLMENRTGMPVAGGVTHATGDAERKAALKLLATARKGAKRVTLGTDAAYDDAQFVTELRQDNVTPHVSQHTKRTSYIDGRTTRHPGYQISQKKRKCVEHIFGWLKTTGMLRKLRHRGLQRVQWSFTFALAAYNLVRLRKLVVQPA